MRSRLVIALVTGFVVAACAASASAQVPDPAYSSVPAFIRLGGAQTLAGTPDPTIAFTMTLRDYTNNPIVGATVYVDFTNCSDTRLCSAVVGGRVVECSSHVVTAVTDGAGKVTMSLFGAGVNAGSTIPPAIAPGADRGCIRVYTEVEQFATVTAILYDPNGALPTGNGVNGLDLSITKTDVGASGLGAPYRGRSDYTGDYAVNGADLAALRLIVGNSALGLGSGAGCAGGGTTQPYCP